MTHTPAPQDIYVVQPNGPHWEVINHFSGHSIVLFFHHEAVEAAKNLNVVSAT